MIEAFTIRLGIEMRQAEVRAIVLIEVEGKAADHVAQRLRGVPEVRALYSTNGRWDFVAELEDRDLASFDETLRRLRLIDGIRSTETNILLNAGSGPRLRPPTEPFRPQKARPPSSCHLLSLRSSAVVRSPNGVCLCAAIALSRTVMPCSVGSSNRHVRKRKIEVVSIGVW